ncbi:MAG: hypothetical protein PHP50_11065 [Lachnospiraceae bacterium]|nr:hypothetical protein [Lachnospiraceae bacterium]
MDLLSQIKKSMRIKHTELDDDITADIEAGTLDLIRVGIQPYQKENDEYVTDENGKKVMKDDALICKAIELYCKAQADYQGKQEQYTAAYEKLRDSLSLCGDYIE